MELMEWLRAQFDEDERVAREAAPGPWRWVDPGGNVKQALVSGRYPWDFPGSMVLPSAAGDVFPQVGDANHITRHDPARVLAEVESKRRILDIAEVTQSHADDNAEAEASWWLILGVVSALALPYADRPGYQPEWKP